MHNFEDRQWTWEDFELRASKGQCWYQIDNKEQPWDEIELDSMTWLDIEHLVPYGLTWGELYGASAYLLEHQFVGESFTKIYDGMGVPVSPLYLGTTWKDKNPQGLKHDQHYAHTDFIPYGKKFDLSDNCI